MVPPISLSGQSMIVSQVSSGDQNETAKIHTELDATIRQIIENERIASEALELEVQYNVAVSPNGKCSVKEESGIVIQSRLTPASNQAIASILMQKINGLKLKAKPDSSLHLFNRITVDNVKGKMYADVNEALSNLLAENNPAKTTGLSLEYEIEVGANGRCRTKRVRIITPLEQSKKQALVSLIFKRIDELQISNSSGHLTILTNTLNFYEPAFKEAEETIADLLIDEMEALTLSSVSVDYAILVSPEGKCAVQKVSVHAYSTLSQQENPAVNQYLESLIREKINALQLASHPGLPVSLNNQDLKCDVPASGKADLPTNAAFKERNSAWQAKIAIDNYQDTVVNYEKWLQAQIMGKRSRTRSSGLSPSPSTKKPFGPDKISVCSLPKITRRPGIEKTEEERAAFSSREDQAKDRPLGTKDTNPTPIPLQTSPENALQEKLNAYLKDKLAQWVENPVEKKILSYKTNWLGSLKKVFISNEGNQPEKRGFYRTLEKDIYDEIEKGNINFHDGLKKTVVKFESAASEIIKATTTPLKLAVTLTAEGGYKITLLNKDEIPGGEEIQEALKYADLDIVLSPEEKAALEKGEIRETIVEINPKPALVS